MTSLPFQRHAESFCLAQFNYQTQILIDEKCNTFFSGSACRLYISESDVPYALSLKTLSLLSYVLTYYILTRLPHFQNTYYV